MQLLDLPAPVSWVLKLQMHTKILLRGSSVGIEIVSLYEEHITFVYGGILLYLDEHGCFSRCRENSCRPASWPEVQFSPLCADQELEKLHLLLWSCQRLNSLKPVFECFLQISTFLLHFPLPHLLPHQRLRHHHQKSFPKVFFKKCFHIIYLTVCSPLSNLARSSLLPYPTLRSFSSLSFSKISNK